MTDDALDVLRRLVSALDNSSFMLDVESERAIDAARAYLAAQEPRPEPTANEDAHWLRCWGDDEMARGNVSNAQRFTEIADLLDAAPSPAQQTMAAESMSGGTVPLTGGTEVGMHPLPRDVGVDNSVPPLTPTVEIDERRLKLVNDALTEIGLLISVPLDVAHKIHMIVRKLAGESALAERQRAAADARDAARTALVREAITVADYHVKTGVGRHCTEYKLIKAVKEYRATLEKKS